MISLDDYTSHDGLGLAGLVARKEVTAKELADAARQAIDKVNPRINAVLQTLSAESASGSSPGPFAGVPFLIKELVLHAKNVRCDAGCRLAQGFVHPRVLTLAGGHLPGPMRLTFAVSLMGVALLYATLWKYEMAAKSARMQVRALRRALLGEDAVRPLRRSAAPS